jgi:hypothetical protein
MTPKPVAIGLILCDRVIVDKDTNSPSAAGIFTGLAVEEFPTESQRFSALAMLTDSQGDGRIRLAVFRFDEHWLRQEGIYATAHAIQFPDRFAVVNFNLRVRTIRFPAPGSYEFVLFVDADEVALTAIDAGAEDVDTDGDETIEIYTTPADLERVRQALETAGVAVESAESTMVAKQTVELDSSKARQALRLVEALEDLDDVQRVTANFDIPEDVFAEVAG